MSDEETEDIRPDEHDPEILLYDYAKHLLSLSLLALGGVLSIAQASASPTLPKLPLIVAISALAISALLALSCSSAVVKARLSRTPLPRAVQYYRNGAMGFLGMRTSIFLIIWIKALL